ncbi:hypothetical protein D3C73_1304780 [compost metagenome]
MSTSSTPGPLYCALSLTFCLDSASIALVLDLIASEIAALKPSSSPANLAAIAFLKMSCWLMLSPVFVEYLEFHFTWGNKKPPEGGFSYNDATIFLPRLSMCFHLILNEVESIPPNIFALL